jgi:hypothetical protein
MPGEKYLVMGFCDAAKGCVNFRFHGKCNEQETLVSFGGEDAGKELGNVNAGTNEKSSRSIIEGKYHTSLASSASPLAFVNQSIGDVALVP